MITIAIAVLATALIYFFGRTTPSKAAPVAQTQHSADDGHDHGPVAAELSVDSILLMAKKQLSPGLLSKINEAQSVATGSLDKEDVTHAYHKLTALWGDSARIFEPYAWYKAESARLENSEKNLTFAARLFLENLEQERNPALLKWKATQAKDLFERSLKLNPQNDSAKVGLGAAMIFGNISQAPMKDIGTIKEVADRDSTNAYAQLTLAKASILSGQYDKAVGRLETVARLEPDNVEACLMLADVFERTGNKKAAIAWYEKSMKLINLPDASKEIGKRIEELKK